MSGGTSPAHPRMCVVLPSLCCQGYPAAGSEYSPVRCRPAAPGPLAVERGRRGGLTWGRALAAAGLVVAAAVVAAAAGPAVAGLAAPAAGPAGLAAPAAGLAAPAAGPVAVGPAVAVAGPAGPAVAGPVAAPTVQVAATDHRCSAESLLGTTFHA